MNSRTIYCCGCLADVQARLTCGREVYPHRADLGPLPYWKCDACGNFVGCHHKSNKRTRPLGCIPTKAIREARSHIHSILDPLWRSGRFSRSKLYGMIAHVLGVERYHTGDIRTVEQAREVYRIVREIGSAR